MCGYIATRNVVTQNLVRYKLYKKILKAKSNENTNKKRSHQCLMYVSDPKKLAAEFFLLPVVVVEGCFTFPLWTTRVWDMEHPKCQNNQ